MKPCLKTNKQIKSLVLDSTGRVLTESQESQGSGWSSKPGVVAKAAPNTEKRKQRLRSSGSSSELEASLGYMKLGSPFLLFMRI